MNKGNRSFCFYETLRNLPLPSACLPFNIIRSFLLKVKSFASILLSMTVQIKDCLLTLELLDILELNWMQLCNYIILGQIYQISNTFWQYYYYEVIIIFSVSINKNYYDCSNCIFGHFYLKLFFNLFNFLTPF